jgi:hypothetical protein
MTIKQLRKLIAEKSEKFDLTHHKQAILRGLLIFAKHDDDMALEFGHDVIYADSIEGSLEYLSDEDIHELIKLNWHIDENSECWCHH